MPQKLVAVIRQLKHLFDEYDLKKDGAVDQMELTAAMSRWEGVRVAQQKEIWREMDKDKDGAVSFTEFVRSKCTHSACVAGCGVVYTWHVELD